MHRAICRVSARIILLMALLTRELTVQKLSYTVLDLFRSPSDEHQGSATTDLRRSQPDLIADCSLDPRPKRPTAARNGSGVLTSSF